MSNLVIPSFNDAQRLVKFNNELLESKDDIKSLLVESLLQNKDWQRWMDISAAVIQFKNNLYKDYNMGVISSWDKRSQLLKGKDKSKSSSSESGSSESEGGSSSESESGSSSSKSESGSSSSGSKSESGSSSSGSESESGSSSSESEESESDDNMQSNSESEDDNDGESEIIWGNEKNVCKVLMNNKLSKDSINDKRKQIYKKILPMTGNNPNKVNNMKSSDISQIYKYYDKIFFNDKLSEYLPKNYNLTFTFGKTRKVGGHCKYSKNVKECNIEIMLSLPVITSVFNSSKSSKIEIANGVKCYSQIDCLQSVFEHELVHMIIDIWCYELVNVGKKRKSHGEVFKSIANNIFGHTDFYHSIGSGQQRSHADHRDKLQGYLTVGKEINVYNKERNTVTKFTVLKVNNRADARRILAVSHKDGKRWRIGLNNILLPGEMPKGAIIEKGKMGIDVTKQLASKSDNLEKVQNYLKVGKIVETSRNGIKEKYRVEKLNNRSNAVYFLATKLSDGKKYRVPLSVVVVPPK